MAISIARDLSLKTSKLALVLLSLFGILSTLYVYDFDYGIETPSSTRLMKKQRLLKKGKKVPLPPRKELIWLMAYPGAGADQTMNMIERATGKSMGTNYGNTVQTQNMKSYTNVHVSTWLQKEWYKEGAFINNIDYLADTSEVYVKTHCTGYCLYEKDSGFCTRIPYIRSLIDINKFWIGCARGNIYLPPRPITRAWNKKYQKNRVRKALVLVRNPLEIVVSRFLEYARANDGVPQSRKGLIQFCEKIDKLYRNVKETKNMRRKPWVKDHIDGVPCYTEFYRIFEWHKHTWVLAKNRKNIRKYREDFKNNLIGTAEDILNFAGLSRMEGREILPVNDEVNIMFTDEEKQKISQFMQAVGKNSSPMWKQYFARYF